MLAGICSISQLSGVSRLCSSRACASPLSSAVLTALVASVRLIFVGLALLQLSVKSYPVCDCPITVSGVESSSQRRFNAVPRPSVVLARPAARLAFRAILACIDRRIKHC